MEVALRRRLEGVAEVSISQREQTAEVTFAKGDYAFSSDAFRKAVAEAGVVVLSFQIDACGSIEQEQEQRWLVTDRNRFLLTAGDTLPSDQPICVSGRLDDRAPPLRLHITDVQKGTE
jgi:hypothetical protein